MASAVAEAPLHVAHHDATRAAVSTTALGVCAMRCWESKKDPSERLLYDPFAAILCGDENPQLPLKEEVGLTKEFWIDFIAVRSLTILSGPTDSSEQMAQDPQATLLKID